MSPCVLIMTGDPLPEFKAGKYNDGKLMILYPEKKEFEEDQATASFALRFQTLPLDVSEIYMYLENFESVDDPTAKVIAGMLSVVNMHFSKREDRSRVHILGCQCRQNLKRRFADEQKFDFIPCDCGGWATLKEIISRIMAKA